MADITSVKLGIGGEAIGPDPETGAIEKDLAGPAKLKLVATAEPSAVTPDFGSGRRTVRPLKGQPATSTS